MQAQNLFTFVLNNANAVAGELSDAKTASIQFNQLSLSDNRSSFKNFLFERTRKNNFAVILHPFQRCIMLIISIDIDSICE